MHFFFVKKEAERELIIYLFLPISGQIGIIYLFICQLKVKFAFFFVKKGAERELIIYLFLPISGQIGIIYLFFCQLKVRLAFFATLGREPLILFVFGPNWLLVFEIAPLRTRFTSYLGLGGTPSPKIGTI